MLLQQSIEHVSIIYACNPHFCNALVHVIYAVVSGQYLYTIPDYQEITHLLDLPHHTFEK